VGLEVLGHAPAIALYERCGFRRRWTRTIMTRRCDGGEAEAHH